MCLAPQSWAHSTHLAGTDDQPGGSPPGGVLSVLLTAWVQGAAAGKVSGVRTLLLRDRLLVVDVLHVRFLVLLFQIGAEHPDEVVGARVVAVRGDGNTDQ